MRGYGVAVVPHAHIHTPPKAGPWVEEHECRSARGAQTTRSKVCGRLSKCVWCGVYEGCVAVHRRRLLTLVNE